MSAKKRLAFWSICFSVSSPSKIWLIVMESFIINKVSWL